MPSFNKDDRVVIKSRWPCPACCEGEAGVCPACCGGEAGVVLWSNSWATLVLLDNGRYRGFQTVRIELSQSLAEPIDLGEYKGEW